MDYFIGLDIGTTAIKGVLMTVEGKVVDSFTGGYNYIEKENQKLRKKIKYMEMIMEYKNELRQLQDESEIHNELYR